MVTVRKEVEGTEIIRLEVLPFSERVKEGLNPGELNQLPRRKYALTVHEGEVKTETVLFPEGGCEGCKNVFTARVIQLTGETGAACRVRLWGVGKNRNR